MRKIVTILFVLTLAFALTEGNEDTVQSVKAAKTEKKISETGLGCQKGRYLYYAFEMGGVRMGIMRYDVKTRKSKEIFSYLYKGKDTNGFYNISVKGKYIYAVWDQAYGTAGSRNYIYRIAKDGSSSKRLAIGIDPVIRGNRIYYQKCKLENVSGETFTSGTEKYYSMKLNGKDKKKVKEPDYKKVAWNAYDTEETTDTIRGYRYYVKNNTLYRQNVKSGKSFKLMSCSHGLDEFYVCGDYILVRGTVKSKDKSGQGYKSAAYIIKTTGKDKKMLANWIPAE